MKYKYCTKCGKPFDALGREVICPSCKAQAAEETKRAAVLKAKKASWNGESVPVRISGRASTVIRRYGAAHGLPFAAALDALLQASDYVKTSGKAWEAIEPYKSHRRDKHTTETQDAQTAQEVKDAPQEAPQDTASKPQEAPQEAPQEVKAAKKAVKTTSKAAGKAAAAAKKGGKA